MLILFLLSVTCFLTALAATLVSVKRFSNLKSLNVETIFKHLLVFVVFISAFAWLIKYFGTRHEEQTITAVCYASYECLKSAVWQCKNEYELDKVRKEIEDFYQHYKGRVSSERVTWYYENLKSQVLQQWDSFLPKAYV